MKKGRYIQDSVLLRAALGLLLAVCVDLVLHGVHVKAEWERLWTLLTMLCAFAFSVLVEQKNIPSRFERLRAYMFEAGKAARQDDLLDNVLKRATEQFERRLVEIHKFSYSDVEGVIPQLSLETVRRVKWNAFATFVADNREHIYIDAHGRQYLEAWFEKADELKDKRPKPLRRVFITSQIGDLSEDAFQLVQEHLEKDVEVFVIERKIAEHLRRDCELDFALFDDRCLMTVKPLSEGINQLLVLLLEESHLNLSEIQKYQEFRERLLRSATPGQTFMTDYSKPMNAAFWNNKMGSGPSDIRLEPPHALSPADAKEMVEMAVRMLPEDRATARVAILGLTPQLIEACEANPAIIEVHLIDQTNIVLPFSSSGKTRKPEHTNWLDLKGNNSFDAILGDEALNNLALKQYREFFRVMKTALAPHGTLLLRTLGRFDESEPFSKVQVKSLLDWIKAAPASISETERGATILTFLHSTEIALDEQDSLIRAKRYNDQISSWVRAGDLTSSQARPFYFPTFANQDIRLSSPTRHQLELAWSPYFNQMPFFHVDDSYCGADKTLCGLYRITPFRPINGI